MLTVTWKESDKKGKEQVVTRLVRHVWEVIADMQAWIPPEQDFTVDLVKGWIYCELSGGKA